MAYEKIFTQILTEYIQQEPYARAWSELVVKQDVNSSNNSSTFRIEMNICGTAGNDSSGFTLEYYSGGMGRTWLSLGYSSANNTSAYTSNETQTGVFTLSVAPGKTVSKTVKFINTTNLRNNFGSRNIQHYHNLNGSFGGLVDKSSSTGTSIPFTIYGSLDFLIKGLDYDRYTTKENFNYAISSFLPTDRALKVLTANNFTDEENPSFTYQTDSSSCLVKYNYNSKAYLSSSTNPITSIQVALSLDGETDDVPYREIPLNNTSYTFNLTDEERETLRAKAQGSTSFPVYYLTKITRKISTISMSGTTIQPTASNGDTYAEFIGKTERILTIVGCNPTLNSTVKDIKPETLALTGNENTFVRYESMAEYAINAIASKHATIVSQSVQCGSKVIENLPYGVIDDVESAAFIFYVLDSRGMAAQSLVQKNLVEYVKPTCYQKLEIELSGETGANVKLTVNGNYYNGSFGAADNSLLLEVRYTDANGNMGAWKTLTGTPTFSDNTYKLEATLSGFNYGNGYTFQCRATDKLNVVQSSQYTIRLLPVFDWSEKDFNFNVPVNIDAEDLSMHGETIIRHSESTNNTVVSASNGNIYIRPGGTDSTSGETIFYGNGNVKFNGTVTFADGTTGGGASDPTDAFADYVIQIGEEAMGTNGTWYWRKWNSGKAEAWGCRNFGNMAVTTAWGNLYRSAILTQNLPNNVFVRTPDSININIVHATFGGWICKHEQTAPSAATTGSFIFVRPASATVTAPTNIGFYIVGEWY